MVKVEHIKDVAQALAQKYKELIKAAWLVVEDGLHTLIILLDDTKGEIAGIDAIKSELRQNSKVLQKQN